MELIDLKDIKSLYQSAKSSGLKADADAYIEAVNDCLQNNPYQYASNIEYIISSSYGIKTFKEFFDRYGIPIVSYDTIMESVDEAIKKCSYRNINSDIYKEAKTLLESFKDKYQNAFIMFEAYNDISEETHDEYVRAYYKEQFKVNVPRVLSQFGEAAIPDIIIEADKNNKVETTFRFLSEAITSDEPAKHYQWLSEIACDIKNPSDGVKQLKKKFTENSLEGIVNSIKLRNVILHKESVLMDEHRNIEYSESEVQTMKDFISFKEYYMTAIDDPGKILTIQNQIVSVYEEFDGIIPEEESCADIVEMLPSSTVGNKVLTKQPNPGMNESTGNKKSGKAPDYLKNHHDLTYGEDDSNKSEEPGGDPKLSTSTSDDADGLIPPSEFLRKTADTSSKDGEKKDDKKDNDNQLTTDNKGPVNNYYYTYNNSFNKHRTDDHSTNHNDSSLEYNVNSKNKTDDVKTESVDMFSLNIFKEASDDTDENVDPEKPTSDHPIRDTLMDIDRKLIKKQQEVKKTVQDAVNVGKTFIKPAQRTAGWIDSMVNQWKDTNETKIKEKMADPRSRQGLYQSIKKAILAGSLFKAGLLLNPIFLFLAVTKKVSDSKNSFRIRNEMIGELKAEVSIIDEKIKDADNNRDNGAKYKLMRLKNEIQKKLLRVEGGKKVAKII